VRVGASSTLHLVAFDSRRQQLKLERGTVRCQLAPLKPKVQFAVLARDVRAQVKGTLFEVELREDDVHVRVEEGLVRVDSARQRFAALELPAGQQVMVAAKATRAAPTALGAPRETQVHLLQWPSLGQMLATTSLVTISSQPTGAELHLDSRPLGQTQLVLRGEPGKHLVELFRNGRLIQSRWLTLTGDEATLGITLRGQRRVPRLPPRIHRYIARHAVQLRLCYERQLKRDARLSGDLTLQLQIDAEGQIQQLRLLRDTFGDRLVGQCVTRTIKQRWRFPPGEPVRVVYPFVFRPE